MTRSPGEQHAASAQGALLDWSRIPSSRRSPIAPDVRIPGDGERVDWTSALRADIPHYLEEQIDEATHKLRCTRVSLILHALAAYKVGGRSVFVIREEDLAADRRKCPRNAAPVPPVTVRPSVRTRQIWPTRPGSLAQSE